MNRKLSIIHAIFLILFGACVDLSQHHAAQQAQQEGASDASAGSRRKIEIIALIWRPGSTSQAIIEADNDKDSPRLRIQTTGHADFVLSVPGGLVKLSDGIMKAALLKMNTASASYIYAAKNLKARDGTAIIALTGRAYASDPGSVRFISVNAAGKPYELYSSDTFELADLRDIDNDGLTEIIGKHALSQTWGRCFTTYDPFSVYHLSLNSEEKAFFSIALSKRYNLIHYYGWVGAEPSEDWAVVLCAPGGPKIVKADEAEKQFGH
jgi:hypothetical protein